MESRKAGTISVVVGLAQQPLFVSLWNNVSSQNNMKPIIDPEET
jgi:hypothetical protein